MEGNKQESVLALITFLVYLNDMTEGVSSYISMYTADVQLLRKIKKPQTL